MPKTKPFHKQTLKDLMTPTIDGVASGNESSRVPDLSVIKFNEDMDASIKQYNKNILELDPEYTKLKPMQKVLVRVFLKELRKTEDGLYLPNTEFVRLKTHAGVGYVGEVESPFPYSQKAVVVSVPDSVTTIKSGDIVYLSNKPIQAVPDGSGNEARITIPNAFIHPELGDDLSTNPNDRLYGYLQVNYFEIDFKLN